MQGIPEQESLVLLPCSICSRKFASERIDKHMTICAKATNKKRKVFNMSKARKKGTDLEKFTSVKAGYATHKQALNKVREQFVFIYCRLLCMVFLQSQGNVYGYTLHLTLIFEVLVL